MIPEDEEREIVHKIIYDELCAGIVKEDSRKKYQAVIANLKKRGAQGVNPRMYGNPDADYKR